LLPIAAHKNEVAFVLRHGMVMAQSDGQLNGIVAAIPIVIIL